MMLTWRGLQILAMTAFFVELIAEHPGKYMRLPAIATLHKSP